ncbi:zinc finger, CCHC-type containing protein [Tanacetum coccineum]
MDEFILVSSIIDKLPPSWKDFKHSLKHNKDELSFLQLGSHFRIEESLTTKESAKGIGKEIVGSSSVNIIEDDDAFAWWIDSGATCHACKDRCWFDTFHPVQDGSVLHIGDESTKLILGRGNVVLEFSSGKTITLVNVVYVPGLRKNLMSGPVLNKCGYKQVYESDKYILSRHGVFVGFGYYNNGMFMLNLNKVPNTFSSVCMISSKDVDSSMWHARLGHVHYKRMLAMSKDNLISEFDITLEKCNTCMLTKITIEPCKEIKRDSNVLELIHSDLCNFHATPSLGNKNMGIRHTKANTLRGAPFDGTRAKIIRVRSMRGMEPRPIRVRETTLVLRIGSSHVRRHRGRVVELEDAPNRDGRRVERESDGRRPKGY